MFIYVYISLQLYLYSTVHLIFSAFNILVYHIPSKMYKAYQILHFTAPLYSIFCTILLPIYPCLKNMLHCWRSLGLKISIAITTLQCVNVVDHYSLLGACIADQKATFPAVVSAFDVSEVVEAAHTFVGGSKVDPCWLPRRCRRFNGQFPMSSIQACLSSSESADTKNDLHGIRTSHLLLNPSLSSRSSSMMSSGMTGKILLTVQKTHGYYGVVNTLVQKDLRRIFVILVELIALK